MPDCRRRRYFSRGAESRFWIVIACFTWRLGAARPAPHDAAGVATGRHGPRPAKGPDATDFPGQSAAGGGLDVGVDAKPSPQWLAGEFLAARLQPHNFGSAE